MSHVTGPNTDKTERDYTQIEKDTIDFKYFEQYVYGMCIDAQTNHKPLESIIKKTIADAPKRLYIFLSRLQPINISL